MGVQPVFFLNNLKCINFVFCSRTARPKSTSGDLVILITLFLLCSGPCVSCLLGGEEDCVFHYRQNIGSQFASISYKLKPAPHPWTTSALYHRITSEISHATCVRCHFLSYRKLCFSVISHYIYLYIYFKQCLFYISYICNCIIAVYRNFSWVYQRCIDSVTFLECLQPS